MKNPKKPRNPRGKIDLMKKVVILSAFLSPLRAGAEACAEEVPLALSDRFDFTIVTARMRRDLPRHDLLQGKIPVLRIGVGYTFDKWLYPFLAPLAVRKIRPDVVHAILESFAGLALVFCRAPKKILTCQTTNTNFLRGWILKAPNIVTAINRDLIGNCKSKYCFRKILYIPNGVNLHDFKSAAKDPKKHGRILFVGRLESMKGVDTLLDAFKIASQDHDLHLRIVGDGSCRDALEKQSKNLGIADRVSFLGYKKIKEVIEEYANAEIFCGLSRTEAFGNVFIEAQAAGCAVVATNVDGVSQVVAKDEGHKGIYSKRKYSALLVEPDNPRQAAKCIVKIFKDKDLRLQLVKLGKKNAESYDWSDIAKRYAELY